MLKMLTEESREQGPDYEVIVTIQISLDKFELAMLGCGLKWSEVSGKPVYKITDLAKKEHNRFRGIRTSLPQTQPSKGPILSLQHLLPQSTLAKSYKGLAFAPRLFFRHSAAQRPTCGTRMIRACAFVWKFFGRFSR